MKIGNELFLTSVFSACLLCGLATSVYAAGSSHAKETEHAAPARSEAADGHGSTDEHAPKMNEHAPKHDDGHGSMDEHAAKSNEEHGARDEHAQKPDDGHGSMDENAAKSSEEHGEQKEHALKPDNGHGSMDEHASKPDGDHGTKDEHASKPDDGHGTTDEHAAASGDGHGSSDEHGEEGENGEGHKKKMEQFKMSFEPHPPGPNQPWRLIRRLQLLQDRIARGKKGALKNYRRALVAVSQNMLADNSKETWNHERNIMAAATYLLIGGNPKAGQHAFEISELSLIQKKPLAAALAYVERKYGRANRLLSEFEVKVLPSSARGQFALVKAMVMPSAKSKEASIFLEQARRYSPGTLTEEAALRRLIRIAGEHISEEGGVDHLLTNANAYFRHYSKSTYVTDFLRNYGFGIVRSPAEKGSVVLEHLQRSFEKLKKTHQVFLIAIVARNSVVLGKIELGQWASSWLLKNVASDDKLRARIELYQIATSILNPDDYIESANQLNNLEVDLLGKQDQRLYMAIKQMSTRIGSPPVDVEKLKELARIEEQSFPGDEPELPFDVAEQMKLAATNSLLVKANKMFAMADELLSK